MWTVDRPPQWVGRGEEQALASAGLPAGWRARMLALLAMLQRAATEPSSWAITHAAPVD